ncbi:MAG: hypothetical protein IPM84_15435 [Anaerolineae bacterium]|nr:hypothetical protein [Anaerolineae bacterium]
MSAAQIDHEYHPDWLNTVALGQYLDTVERQFILSTLARDPSVHRLVDLSGGSGRIAIPLVQHGFDVTVTDVSIIPLRRLRQKDRSIRAELVDPAASMLPWPTPVWTPLFASRFLSTWKMVVTGSFVKYTGLFALEVG